MAEISNSNSFTIGAAATQQDSVSLLVLPLAAVGEGTGRLVHPTLGTYDYLHPPNEWTNIDTDVVIQPIWRHARTLSGAADTLWPGHLRDVECSERWTAPGGLSMTTTQLRMLISMWMNPPDPAVEHVEWYPSYCTTLGYRVIIRDVNVKGSAVTLDQIAVTQNWVVGPVTVRYRIVDRA